MTAIYKWTTMYNRSNLGWSETWLTTSLSTSQAAKVISTAMDMRMGMLPITDSVIGVRIVNIGLGIPPYPLRVSKMCIPGVSSMPDDVTASVVVPGSGGFEPAPTRTVFAELRANLQIDLHYGSSGVKPRYLVGLPVGILQAEPASVFINANDKWMNRYNAWASFITDNMQILAQDPAAPTYPILGFAIGTQTLPLGGILIKVPTAGSSPFIQGDRIAIQGVRGPKGLRGSPTINGRWTVDSAVVPEGSQIGLVFLTQSNPIVTVAPGGTVAPIYTNRALPGSKCKKVLVVPTPLKRIEWQRALIHKRGRPFGSPLGRRLIRATLDP